VRVDVLDLQLGRVAMAQRSVELTAQAQDLGLQPNRLVANATEPSDAQGSQGLRVEGEPVLEVVLPAAKPTCPPK
jgi:hypothetical protein